MTNQQPQLPPRGIRRSPWLGLVMIAVTLGLLVFVWAGVRSQEAVEPRDVTKVVRSPLTTVENAASGSSGAIARTPGASGSRPRREQAAPRPDPATVRPPLDNPGGVNGERPPRPIPGLATQP